MSFAPSETWDLESIYPGGTAGSAFREALEAVEADARALIPRADALGEDFAPADLAAVLLEIEALDPRLSQLGAFAGCHGAADASSEAANRAEMLISQVGALLARASVVPSNRIAFCTQATFDALLALPEIAHMHGYLHERRSQARFRMPPGEEALVTELAVDGVLAWGQLYDVESGALKIRFDRGNGEEALSPGQLFNYTTHDDRPTRLRASEAWRAGWKPLRRTCATVLTHLTGTRIVLNQRRKLDELEEPLEGAKIERRTLEAMLEVCRRAQPLLTRYLTAKAKVLGVEKLAWADCHAPVGTSKGQITYPEAQDFIVEQFGAFAPGFADFAKKALTNRWIEVEDRPGKRQGGFCTEIALREETRIFMTWGNNSKSLTTLAHELGHAFHGEVLFSVPPAQRRLPMTLAETASVFAETLVREATLGRPAPGPERLRQLDDSLSAALSFLANIPARFELERAFYTLRANGPLDADTLDATTREIFSRWYGPAVGEVDETYWQSKLHFYIGGLAFYNFPYTFGYLFANLVYAHFRPLGAEGLPAYVRLLKRTGDEPAEKIAKEELGFDLGDPEVWAKALSVLERDLAAFEGLVYTEA